MEPFSSLVSRWPLMAYTAMWTLLLILAVAVGAFWPEVAFVSAISSSTSTTCNPDRSIRVLLDEILCLPAHFFTSSNIDLIVPPIFAAVIVAASALLVRSLALWDDHFLS